MNPKRILYCEGNIDGTVGGSYYILYDLVTKLDKSKYYPIVVFYNENVVAEKLREAGIETHIFERSLPINLTIKNSNFLSKIINKFLSIIQKLTNSFVRIFLPAMKYSKYLKENKVDLVNLNNSIVRNHDWMLGAKFAGVKCMTHEMGINDEFSWLSRYFAKNLTSIICLSDSIRDNMIKCGINYPYIKTIYCGLDPDRYKIEKTPSELKKIHNLSDNIPTIGVIGNIKMWKGQETVVKATALIKKEIPDIRCFIVGDVSNYKFDQEYYNNIKNLTEELHIKENIIFTGYQKNPIDYMNFVDIVIHTSVKPEPFGIVILEAMLVKKPLIATNFGGPAEIIINDKTGFLVTAGEPRELAEKVISIFSHYQDAKNIGEAGYQRLIDSFTLDKNVSETEKEYERIFTAN